MRNLKYILLTVLLLCGTGMPAEGATQKKSPAKSVQKSSRQSGKKKAMTAKELKRYNARRFDIHNVYFYGGAGYSGLVNSGSRFTTGGTQTGSSQFTGGGGMLLGAGYEYNYKKFLLSAGPEFRLFSSADRLNFTEPYEQPLSEYNQTKNYYLRNMQEQQLPMQVMLPLMLGARFDKWYFKAGGKIGWTVYTPFSQRGDVYTTITDPDAWADEWANIPGHGATEAPYRLTGVNRFGLDGTISAEIGILLDQLLSQDWVNQNEDRARPWRMRIALFADYGLPNWQTGETGVFATTTEEKIETRSLLQSDWAPGRMNSLLVGVKFTALLQMNKVRAAKKQNGYMAVYTYDSKQQKALPGVALAIQGESGRPLKKSTNGRGVFSKRQPEGEYTVDASKSGYLPQHGIQHYHGEDNDTVRIGLRPVPVYRFVVCDSKTGRFVAAQAEFLPREGDKAVATVKTDTVAGSGSVKLPTDGAWRIHITAPDYLSYTADIADTDSEERFTLEPIVRKRAIILHDLYFATNSVVILPESEAGLQDLYDLLNENQELRIRIIGHTDSVGSDEDNQRLSEGRAGSVKDEMVRRGIHADRIEAEGRGEKEPIDTNDTEEGRARNRRVELVIL